MERIIALCTQALPLVISLLALVITYLTFERQRTFDNENYLFKYKIEKYNDILGCLVENLNFLKKEVTDYYDKKLDGEMEDEYFERKQDEIGDKIEEAELILVAKLVFVSEEVIDKLEKYLDFAFEANFLNSNYVADYDESKIEECRQKDTDSVYKLEDMIYGIAEVMRNDSGVEPLKNKLDKRLWHKQKRKYIGAI